MGAVPEKRDQGTEHGEDGDRHRDRNGERVFVLVLVFGQFDVFAHFWCGVLSWAMICLRNYLTNLVGG